MTAQDELSRQIQTQNREMSHDWAIARFHESEADIRWAKERGSSVVQWSVVLSGAIVAGAKAAQLEPWASTLFTLLQTSIAILWLNDLRRFAKATRIRLQNLVPMGADYPVGKGHDPHHVYYFLSQCAVIVGAMLVALATLGSQPQTPFSS